MDHGVVRRGGEWSKNGFVIGLGRIEGELPKDVQRKIFMTSASMKFAEIKEKWPKHWSPPVHAMLLSLKTENPLDSDFALAFSTNLKKGLYNIGGAGLMPVTYIYGARGNYVNRAISISFQK